MFKAGNMKNFTANDFQSCYKNMLIAMNQISTKKNLTDSRVGLVYELGACSYEFDAKNVPYCGFVERRLNPFFALAECAWVLDGSNKLAPLKSFISNYNQYSDDNLTLNGAYGYRLFKSGNIDQVDQVIKILKDDPNTRRAVLSIYSPSDLFNLESKDIPCNTSIYLKIRNGKLDMTVLNRSNDLFLGVPYNVLVFNAILKFIAFKLDIDVGRQLHFTDSLHLYKKNEKNFKEIFDSGFEAINYCHKETNVIFDNLINESNLISNLNFDKLKENTPLSKIFTAYFTFKNCGSVELGDLLQHKDAFSVSAVSWFTNKKEQRHV
jgi:thymidylate synthase